jgi:intracellular multiplication protein IcmV
MLGVAGYFVAAHYSLAGFFLLLTVTALLFANAFRFHFWAFQISQRKLGCTLAEWRRGKCDGSDT